MARARLLALALTAAALPTAAKAGIVATIAEKGGVTTLVTEGNRLRIERGAEPRQVMIWDGDAQTLYQLDPAGRTYSRISQDDARKLAEQLQQALAKLPPAERARVEEGLKQNAGANRRTTTYEATGAARTVAGLACQEYRVLREGKLEEEGCFVPWGPGAVTKADLAPLVSFGKFMERFLAQAYGAAAERAGGLRIAEELDRAPGFPAHVRHVDAEGKAAGEERLTKLERTTVPAERFGVPSGYTKVDAGPR
jgi:hypothetical protein